MEVILACTNWVFYMVVVIERCSYAQPLELAEKKLKWIAREFMSSSYG
jgi:hypothetical protein